jgi:hypothetical protein
MAVNNSILYSQSLFPVVHSFVKILSANNATKLPISCISVPKLLTTIYRVHTTSQENLSSLAIPSQLPSQLAHFLLFLTCQTLFTNFAKQRRTSTSNGRTIPSSSTTTHPPNPLPGARSHARTS